MKPLLIEIPKRPETSFQVIDYERPYFHNPIHFHSYFELTLILQGQGIRITGDHVNGFEEGDLVLIGSNLPHQWKNSPKSSVNGPTSIAKAIVVHFQKSCFGEDFFHAPELSKIHKLLEFAKRGLKIKGKTHRRICVHLKVLLHQSGVQKIQTFLSILDILSYSNDIVPLVSNSYIIANRKSEIEKLDEVYDYVLENLNRKIPLSEMAAKFHMSRTGFCRYFKTRTQKTFSRFVLETRIGIACKLLHHSNFNIAQIAYESGFNSPSFFNKEFKHIKGMTPLQYKRQIRRA